MALHKGVEVGSEFLELVPADVVTLIDGPSGENAANAAILLRVIEQGNAGLAELPEHGGDVEGGFTGVGARDDDARGGVKNARPGRTTSFAEVARVVMEKSGKSTVDEHAAGELVALLSANPSAEGVPALTVVGESIGGLGDTGLQDVAIVSAGVPKLVPGDVPFFAGGEWSLVLLDVICGHEIGNDPEDALGDFVAKFLVQRIDFRRRRIGSGGRSRRGNWSGRRSGGFRLGIGWGRGGGLRLVLGEEGKRGEQRKEQSCPSPRAELGVHSKMTS